MRKCFFEGNDCEGQLEESHDVPAYLFIYSGNRKGKKNVADKHGRHLLCKKHHEEYEYLLNKFLKETAKEFSEDYFNYGAS